MIMKYNIGKITLLSLVFLLALASLSAKLSKENEDLRFIISLFNHQQNALAKKQISLFEKEFPHSAQMNKVVFIKANIALSEYDLDLADSLYTALLGEKLEEAMLIDVLINRAAIQFDKSNYIDQIDLLNKVERMTPDSNQRYQAYVSKGRAYAALLNPLQAGECFSKALGIRPDAPTALHELLTTYILSDDLEGVRSVLSTLIARNLFGDAYTSTINELIDYLDVNQEYSDITTLEKYLQDKKLPYPDSIRLRFARLHYWLDDLSLSTQLISECTSHKAYCDYLTGLILVKQSQEQKADSIFAGLAMGELQESDYLPGSREDLVISSWLERIKILFRTQPDDALSNISRYLADIPPAEHDPYILYVLGNLQFKSRKYQEAITTLLKVKQLTLTPELSHNVQIMLGDIWFNAKVADNAVQSYNSYLNRYPKGRFRDHALYNIALIFFDQKKYEQAKLSLQQIRKSGLNPEIVEKTAFLLAEIDFAQASYERARQQYEQLQAQFIQQQTVDFRIAQCYYYMEQYQAAADLIPQLEQVTDQAYPVLMLKGNIHFNLRQYESALAIYDFAAGKAADEAERQEVSSYKALTLYRLRRFQEATELYLTLTRDEESPQAYLIMAAKASYHAGEYQQSLLLFKQFLAENPQSEYKGYALANLGSIYYNLADYPRAMQTWIDLLKGYKTHKSFTEDEQVILSTAFSGLQWSFLQKYEQTAIDQLTAMADEFSSEYISFELQYLLLKIYYGSEQWSDIITLAENLKAEFPHQENNEIRRYVAASYSGLNQVAAADSIYRQIFSLEPTPDILTEWADLQIKAGNHAEAISKLDQAVQMDPVGVRLNRLLQTASDFQADSVGVYWNEWSEQVDSLLDYSHFIWMQWNHDKGNWPTAQSVSEQLLLNPDYQIRSRAQFIKAASLYGQAHYEEAVVELYRTIYLYSESDELVLEAKTLLVRTYLSLGQMAEAQSVFEEIRVRLGKDLQTELADLLQGGTE